MCASTPTTAPDTRNVVHVAAGAIFNDAGQVLIARRPSGTHLEGLWEFPGGKLQDRETVAEALVRELREELGIQATDFRPLIRLRHAYPEKTILLDVWRVDRFDGLPRGLEGQPVRWAFPRELDHASFPEADVPVIRALDLPDRYLVTPDCGTDTARFLDRLQVCVEQGVRMAQLRVSSIAGDRLENLARLARRVCGEHARLLLNGDPGRAAELGLDGVHLSARRLMSLDRRPLPETKLVAASCHDETELDHACAVGVDFAVLGPVNETASHPGATPLGWNTFDRLVDRATIPVYALGGLSVGDLKESWQHGAQGIAAIRSLWNGLQRESSNPTT